MVADDKKFVYTKGTNIYDVTESGALQASNNLSDLTDASVARTNLGLGTIATQDSDNVNITGGTITGVSGLGAVDSVAGRTGDVVLTSADIGGLGALATQNTVDATTDIINLDTQLGFSGYYESAETVFSSGSSDTFTHSLGAIPKMVLLELVCITTDGGYAVGDRMPAFKPTSANNGGFSIWYSTTEVGISYVQNVATYFVTKTGANFSLTASKWKLVARAWA